MCRTRGKTISIPRSAVTQLSCKLKTVDLTPLDPQDPCGLGPCLFVKSEDAEQHSAKAKVVVDWSRFLFAPLRDCRQLQTHGKDLWGFWAPASNLFNSLWAAVASNCII